MQSNGSPGNHSGMGDNTISELGFLTRSSNRIEILEELNEGNKSSAELKHQLDLPRTTLRRNLMELAEKNWVREKLASNEFETTQAGEIILNSYKNMMNQINTASRIASFYTHLPTSLPVESEAFQKCSITCSTSSNPHAPMLRQADLLEQLEEVRALLPVVSPYFVDSIVNLDTTFDEFLLISEESPFNSLKHNNEEALNEFRGRLDGEIQVVDDVPGYGLYITNSDLLIITFTDSMRIHSLVEAPPESPVGEWIKETHNEYTKDKQGYD